MLRELRVVRSPTGDWLERNDSAGRGEFLASRGHRLHLG